MNPYSVLIKPILSEKSVAVRESEQKYSFVVNRKSTKDDIKKAVELVFEGVEVKSINTNITRGKYRRRGMNVSREPAKKKAVITLKAGHSIKIFDDQ